ncbi:ribosome maturation factor RimM [Angustibacter sp. McL0619]|uniref:ribosome maturation factor RimM n=1 Tax=Angustibacter sp. McL0619 TaxID=3415676 RepID=UPI003CF1A577
MERVVGRIGRAHGLRGEVTVDVRTDVPEQRFRPGARFATDPAELGPLELAEVREHSGTLLLYFAGVDDRIGAEALRGCLLLVSTDAAEEDDAWYEDELVGLRVRSPQGEDLGEVARLDTGGAQDLLVVRRPAGPHVLVPFVRALVPEVDVPGGFVVVDPPGGLFDPENALEDR